MKVLHLIRGGDTGGAKTHVFALLSKLKDMADVKIVCFMKGVFWDELQNIDVEENEKVVLIDVFMPAYRMANVNRSVNRTVTLPAWLNAAALEVNLNFSQVLQEALKEKLAINR